MGSSVNITGEMYERQYAAYRESSAPPLWFRPTLPTYTGPTLIVFPGTLTLQEQIEVSRWIGVGESGRTEMLARCTQRAAIDKITEYIAYYADPAYLAWRDLCESTRIALWRLFMADTIIESKDTVSKSADTAGTGSDPISTPVTMATNVP